MAKHLTERERKKIEKAEKEAVKEAARREKEAKF